MRSFAPKALEPDGVKSRHDMRIAAKRLRYLLETTEFCFGRGGEVARRRARDLQDILGELHDCEVMLPRVERHVVDLREADARAVRERAGQARDVEPALAALAPHRTSYRGLEILMVYLQARRMLLLDRFGAFWAQQERSGIWGRLERSAERVRREARERRRAAKRAERARRELAEAERLEREAASRAAAAAEGLREASGTAGRDAPAGDAPPGPRARPAPPAVRPPAGLETREAGRSNGTEVARDDGG